MKEKLRVIVEESDTKLGKLFDLVVQLLVVISLLSFSLETLPNLSKNQLFILKLIEIVIITIFSIEYLLRIFVTNKKFKYIFSFYGLIDLLTILPFYLSLTIDLRSLRALRLLRLFRILKLVRFNKAINRFQEALKIAREEIIIFIFATCIVLYLSSVGIFFFENAIQPDKFSSVFHSLWWAIVTLTTVGYGDIYPLTLGGRIFTFFILILGLGVVGIPAGLIASALTAVRRKEENDSKKIIKSYN